MSLALLLAQHVSNASSRMQAHEDECTSIRNMLSKQ